MRQDPPEVISTVILETLEKLSKENYIDLDDVSNRVEHHIGAERKRDLKQFLRKIEEVL